MAVIGIDIGCDIGTTIGVSDGAASPAPIQLGVGNYWDSVLSPIGLGAGGAVETWEDLVGGVVASQTTEELQPPIVSGALNFDGTMYLANLATAAFQSMGWNFAESTDFTVYELINVTSATTTRTVGLCPGTFGGANGEIVRQRCTATNNIDMISVAGATTAAGVIVPTTWQWSYWGREGSTLRHRIQGSAEGTRALAGNYAALFDAFAIGTRLTDLGQKYHGQIKAILVWPGRWLSAGEHTQMQAWAVERMAA